MKPRTLTLLAGLSLLVLTACGTSGNSDLPQTALPPGSPYAGGAQYPWTDKLETPVADPYAGGRDYPWKSAVAVAQNHLSSQALAGGDNVLSDLPWTSASNGWGPVERNRSNGQMNAGDGKTISIRGQTFTKGLGVHATSAVEYSLNAQCQQFTATIGIDDEVRGLGRVTFQVVGDDRVLYTSPELTGKSAALPIKVDVTGVKQLRLNVLAGADNYYDHADWADAKVNCVSQIPSGKVNLSDLPYTSATNGWGPVEINMSNGEQAQFDGKTLSDARTSFTKGLGVHAPSSLTYALNKQCSNLTTSVAIDSEVLSKPGGSVVFEVLGDGRSLYKTGIVKAFERPIFNVDLTGVQTLELKVTDAGDGKNYDHADWLEPVLTCNTPSTASKLTLSSGTLDIFHKHSAGLKAQFSGVSGAVDIKLVSTSPDSDLAQQFASSIQLTTSTINVSDPNASYDLGFYAPSVPYTYGELTMPFDLVVSQNGREIARTPLIINEKLMKVKVSMTPDLFEVKPGEARPFTLAVQLDPPLQQVEPISTFSPCTFTTTDCDFSMVPVSDTYLDGGILKRNYTITFNPYHHPPVGYSLPLYTEVYVGDFLGYRKPQYWTTEAHFTWNVLAP